MTKDTKLSLFKLLAHTVAIYAPKTSLSPLVYSAASQSLDLPLLLLSSYPSSLQQL